MKPGHEFRQLPSQVLFPTSYTNQHRYYLLHLQMSFPPSWIVINFQRCCHPGILLTSFGWYYCEHNLLNNTSYSFGQETWSCLPIGELVQEPQQLCHRLPGELLLGDMFLAQFMIFHHYLSWYVQIFLDSEKLSEFICFTNCILDINKKWDNNLNTAALSPFMLGLGPAWPSEKDLLGQNSQF